MCASVLSFITHLHFMMAASETMLLIYQTVQRHIPQDGNLDTSRENLRTYEQREFCEDRKKSRLKAVTVYAAA